MKRLRDDLDELRAAVDTVAQQLGIPAAHVEKDFWLTEALRGACATASAENVAPVFKGGTSLSKVYGLIERFSEDVDLLIVSPSRTARRPREGGWPGSQTARHDSWDSAETAPRSLPTRPARARAVRSSSTTPQTVTAEACEARGFSWSSGDGAGPSPLNAKK